MTEYPNRMKREERHRGTWDSGEEWWRWREKARKWEREKRMWARKEKSGYWS